MLLVLALSFNPQHPTPKTPTLIRRLGVSRVQPGLLLHTLQCFLQCANHWQLLLWPHCCNLSSAEWHLVQGKAREEGGKGGQRRGGAGCKSKCFPVPLARLPKSLPQPSMTNILLSYHRSDPLPPSTHHILQAGSSTATLQQLINVTQRTSRFESAYPSNSTLRFWWG